MKIMVDFDANAEAHRLTKRTRMLDVHAAIRGLRAVNRREALTRDEDYALAQLLDVLETADEYDFDSEVEPLLEDARVDAFDEGYAEGERAGYDAGFKEGTEAAKEG